MIKYNLKCGNDHEFESWFADSSEFERLNKKKLLECIYCSSNNISKTIMAPMITAAKNEDINKAFFEKKNSREKNDLVKLRNYIEKNFEFVYYDKRSRKSIYGTATNEEKEELAEEGIDLLSIPWVNKDN